MDFFPTNNSTRSQTSFLSKVSISLTMAFFQFFSSYESTPYLRILKSWSIIGKEKIEKELGGVYLSSFLLSQINLLSVKICGSSSSYSCSYIDYNSSSFNSNYIFSIFLSFGRTYCLTIFWLLWIPHLEYALHL